MDFTSKNCKKGFNTFNNQICRPAPKSERYCYNIKDKLGEYGRKSQINFPIFSKAKKPVLSVFRRKEKPVKKSKSYVDIRYPKPVYSPRFRPKVRKNSEGNKLFTEINEVKPIHNGIYPKIHISDTETSDLRSEDEEKKPIRAPSFKGKASLWKKVSKNVEDESKKKEEVGIVK